MQLYIAFHNIDTDRYKPMFCKVIVEDDLYYPLHSDFIQDILREIRFIVSPNHEEICFSCDYEHLCLVDDIEGTPLGTQLSLEFLEQFLSSLVQKYEKDAKYEELKLFYFDRVIEELKNRIKENRYNYYYIILDPNAKEKLLVERFEEKREKDKQLLYDINEPPKCLFDMMNLFAIKAVMFRYNDHIFSKFKEKARAIFYPLEEAPITNIRFHDYIMKNLGFFTFYKDSYKDVEYKFKISNLDSAFDFFYSYQTINNTVEYIWKSTKKDDKDYNSGMEDFCYNFYEVFCEEKDAKRIIENLEPKIIDWEGVTLGLETLKTIDSVKKEPLKQQLLDKVIEIKDNLHDNEIDILLQLLEIVDEDFTIVYSQELIKQHKERYVRRLAVETLDRLNWIPKDEELKADYFSVKSNWKKLIKMKETGLKALLKTANNYVYCSEKGINNYGGVHLKELMLTLTEFDIQKIRTVLEKLVRMYVYLTDDLELFGNPIINKIWNEIAEKKSSKY